MNFIPVAYAETFSNGQIAAQCLVDKINDTFLFPLIALLMALAFLYFLYGAFEYVRHADSDSERETGQQHLIYGVIGMLVMVSAYAILNIAAGTFGLPITIINSSTTSAGKTPCEIMNTQTGTPGGGINTGTPGGGINTGTPGGGINTGTPGGGY